MRCTCEEGVQERTKRAKADKVGKSARTKRGQRDWMLRAGVESVPLSRSPLSGSSPRGVDVKIAGPSWNEGGGSAKFRRGGAGRRAHLLSDA
jgi:hypothetical protein